MNKPYLEKDTKGKGQKSRVKQNALRTKSPLTDFLMYGVPICLLIEIFRIIPNSDYCGGSTEYPDNIGCAIYKFFGVTTLFPDEIATASVENIIKAYEIILIKNEGSDDKSRPCFDFFDFLTLADQKALKTLLRILSDKDFTYVYKLIRVSCLFILMCPKQKYNQLEEHGFTKPYKIELIAEFFYDQILRFEYSFSPTKINERCKRDIAEFCYTLAFELRTLLNSPGEKDEVKALA